MHRSFVNKQRNVESMSLPTFANVATLLCSCPILTRTLCPTLLTPAATRATTCSDETHVVGDVAVFPTATVTPHSARAPNPAPWTVIVVPPEVGPFPGPE